MLLGVSLSVLPMAEFCIGQRFSYVYLTSCSSMAGLKCLVAQRILKSVRHVVQLEDLENCSDDRSDLPMELETIDHLVWEHLGLLKLDDLLPLQTLLMLILGQYFTPNLATRRLGRRNTLMQVAHVAPGQYWNALRGWQRRFLWIFLWIVRVTVWIYGQMQIWHK